MIVVDTSILAAVMMQEADGPSLARRLTELNPTVLSAANWLETAMVASRMGPDGQQVLDDLIGAAAIEILPVTVEQAALARDAFLRFGKGSGSPARLNFGDCFAYALAKSLNAPLLYKGGDFAATDIVSA